MEICLQKSLEIFKALAPRRRRRKSILTLEVPSRGFVQHERKIGRYVCFNQFFFPYHCYFLPHKFYGPFTKEERGGEQHEEVFRASIKIFIFSLPSLFRTRLVGVKGSSTFLCERNPQSDGNVEWSDLEEGSGLVVM